MKYDIDIRNTRPEDIDGITELSKVVYSFQGTWQRPQLESHISVFPEGQFVAVRRQTGEVVGMAASLMILWDDYEMDMSWKDFTDRGWFTNHDPEGRTLYGAEVMVHPDCQGCGIGKKIYAARRELVKRLGLRRIRAGSRLRGYHEYAGEMTARQYVRKVCSGEIGDPTLSFQLRQGFRVIQVVGGYLVNDPESLGYAAVIEWLNPEVAQETDFTAEEQAFHKAVDEEAESDTG
jgi:GNAT superfamily N-acetyltransferase